MTFRVGSGSSNVSGNQVRYAPNKDLTEPQKQELVDHYGSRQSGKTVKSPLGRLTRYDPKHSTYVTSAEQTGPPLTEQETLAKQTGKNAPNSSIHHVMAAGTGQNILNPETLRFNQGAKQVDDHDKTATAEPPRSEVPAARAQAMQEDGRLARGKVRKGFADQAAAVGRMQGCSRAILGEGKGEVKGGKAFDVDAARNDALQGTLTAFQGKSTAQALSQTPAQGPESRFEAYQGEMKNTFDSPGNLRVFAAEANKKVNTGFAAPLDAQGKPSARANRLLDAHQNYGPDRLLTDKRLFTKDDQGNLLSSSKEAAPSWTPPANPSKRKAEVSPWGGAKRARSGDPEPTTGGSKRKAEVSPSGGAKRARTETSTAKRRRRPDPEPSGSTASGPASSKRPRVGGHRARPQ
jgi:hypothetical protein